MLQKKTNNKGWNNSTRNKSSKKAQKTYFKKKDKKKIAGKVEVSRKECHWVYIRLIHSLKMQITGFVITMVFMMRLEWVRKKGWNSYEGITNYMI